MTYHRYKAGQKLSKQLDVFETELEKAVDALLWRMREICVEHGLLVKMARNHIPSGFSVRDRDGILYLGDKTICVSGLTSYGGLIEGSFSSDLPVAWLWKKTWEKEFVTLWVLPWKKEQEADNAMLEAREQAEYKRLKKKYESS